MKQYNTVEELQQLRERLTQIINKKNAYITFLRDEMDRKESYWRKELLKIYQDEKTYTLREIANELDIGVKVFTKTLKKAGILVEKPKGSNIKLELADPYKHLNIDITEYGHEPTYNESSHIYYTEFGKQFLINCYQREVKGSEKLF